MGITHKLSCVISVLRIYYRAVGKRIGVHYRKSLFKVLYSFDTKHRSEYLSLSHAHFGSNSVEYCRSEIKAVVVSCDLDVSAVKHEFCALVYALLYPRLNALFVFCAIYGSEICRLVICGSDFDILCQSHKLFHKLICNALLRYDDRQSHTSLSRATVRRVDYTCGSSVQSRVFKHKRMIFGFAKTLHSLAVLGRRLIDISADGG